MSVAGSSNCLEPLVVDENASHVRDGLGEIRLIARNPRIGDHQRIRDFPLHKVAELGENGRATTFARLLIEEKPPNLRIKPDPCIDVFFDLRLGALTISSGHVTHERDACVAGLGVNRGVIEIPFAARSTVRGWRWPRSPPWMQRRSAAATLSGRHRRDKYKPVRAGADAEKHRRERFWLVQQDRRAGPDGEGSPEALVVDAPAIAFSEEFGLRAGADGGASLFGVTLSGVPASASGRAGDILSAPGVAKRSQRVTPTARTNRAMVPREICPDSLDRKGRMPLCLHWNPGRGLRRGHLTAGRSAGARRLTRSLRLGPVSWGQLRGIHRVGIGTGIAATPSRGCRSLSVSRGVARVPPRGNLIRVTSGRDRDWRRAYCHVGSAFGALCLFPGMPIFRFELPAAGADYPYHGALPGEQWAPVVQQHSELGCDRTWSCELLQLLSPSLEKRARTHARSCGHKERVPSPSVEGRNAHITAVAAGASP